MAKVMLSQKELELVSDAEWILLKNRIMEKVSILFGSLADEWKSNFKLKQCVIDSSLFKHPKISKGEQYQQLPWMVLDYPREFTGHDVLLVRCFFWWGKYFALILLVEGLYQKNFGQQFQEGLLNKGWHFYKGGDKWDNSFSKETFIDNWSQTDIQDKSFLKWIYLIPIKNFNSVEEEMKSAYEQILLCLSPKPME